MSIATVVRFKINFSHLFPPGTDAGYYPLQTRHWLAHGHLMYDDLPLIFWIDAGLAKALMMCGWDGDAAVLLASRLVDCALPPWAAAFVMALGYRWSGGRLSALAGCASAAVSTVLWQPSMVMLSEFQKNALGLVWMVAAVAACSEAMRYGGCRRWGAVAGVMSVSALTHVGAFAATGLALIPALVVWAFLRLSREPGRSVWSVLGPVGFVGCGLVMLIALKAPKRAADLIAAPTTIFHDASWGLGYTSIASTFVVVAIVVAIGVRCVWGERHRQLDGDAAIVIGSAIAATVLAAPKNAVYLDRLALMAGVPAANVFIYAVARRPGRVVSTLGVAALLGSIGIAWWSVGHARPVGELSSVVQANDASALRFLRGEIANPEGTLVIAAHGLEWWAGYFLHTAVRTAITERQSDGTLVLTSIPEDAFGKYLHVFYLRALPFSTSGSSSPRSPAPVMASGATLARTNVMNDYELYELHASRPRVEPRK